MLGLIPRCDPREPAFFIGLAMALAEADRRAALEVYDVRYRYNLNTSTSSRIDDPSFTAFNKAALALITDMRDRIYPWMAEDTKVNPMEELEREWERAYGDPRAEDVKARIEATAAALRATDVKFNPRGVK